MHEVLASEGSEIILTFLQKDLFISDFIFQQKVRRKTNILQDNCWVWGDGDQDNLIGKFKAEKAERDGLWAAYALL